MVLSARRGVIACGPSDADPGLPDAVARLGRALGWPVLAESTSQVRCGPHTEGAAVLARFEALHTWRKERARKRGVESDVIMSKTVLWQLAKLAPRTPEQLAAVERLGPWKRETYGEEILQVLKQLDGQGP